MPASLPAEIWMRVAEFIHKDDLPFILSINSTFFQLGMDVRYRTIWLSTFDDETIKYMPRYRLPAVAHRVRYLSVDLGSQDNKIRRERNGLTWTHKTSVDEVIRAMTNTVTYFANVKTFCIEWEHAPTEEHLLPFLSAAWKTFGSGVQNITFKVALRYLPTLTSTAGNLPELKDLDVVICSDPAGYLPEAENTALADTLAEFVNKAAPTLRILSLFSYTFVSELSPVFCRLGNIPNLERLNVYLGDLPSSTVLNPLGLHRFLRDHAVTLRHLHWTGMSPVYHFLAESKGKDEHAQEQLVSHWLRETKLDAVFSHLLTLQVPVLELALVLPCIRLSADTLTSLRLGGRYMGTTEVNTLANILAARRGGYLRDLDIKVFWLSPEVMVLLAQILPRLEHLGIKFLFMTAKNGESYTYPQSHEAERTVAREFADALRKCDFRHWELRDFGIAKRRDRYDPELDIKLMVLVAECVPSVRTLVGLPKEPVAHIKL